MKEENKKEKKKCIFWELFMTVVPEDTCKLLSWIGLQLLLTVWGVKEKGCDSFSWLFYHPLFKLHHGCYIASLVGSLGWESSRLMLFLRGNIASHLNLGRDRPLLEMEVVCYGI